MAANPQPHSAASPWQPAAASSGAGSLLHNGAVLEALMLDAEHAHRIAQEALAVAATRDDFERGQAMALVGLCVEALGRRPQAREWFREALTAMSARRSSLWYGLTYCFRGRVDADADDVQAAELFLTEAARLLGGTGDAHCLAVQRLCRGHLELARGRRARYAGRLDDAELARETARDVAESVPEGLLDAVVVRLAQVRLNEALDMVEERDSTLPASTLTPGSMVPPSVVPPSVVPPSTGPRSSIPPSTAPPPSARSRQLSHGTLVVSFSGRYYRGPETGLVDLSTRRAPRRILKALADQRERAPGMAVSSQALLEAGWPGERLMPQAGASRVYTAVATLRRMGLKPFLLRRDGGYLLDPACPIARCPDTHTGLIG